MAVTSVAIAACGALAGLGLLLAALGAHGVDIRPKGYSRRRVPVDQLTSRAVLAVGLGVATATLTRWPVAALAASASGALIPSTRRVRRDRAESLARSEAVATWIELVRDTMAAAAGLNEAVMASARVAPAPIREEIAALAIRSEHQPLTMALRRFAADLDDPIADAVVAALVLANEMQARNLGDVLGQIARNAREQVAMRQRIEAGRARTYASAQFIVVITLAFSVGLVLLAPDYLAPFGTAEGQVALAVVVGLFGTAWWSLARLASPRPPGRILLDDGLSA